MTGEFSSTMGGGDPEEKFLFFIEKERWSS